MWGVGVLCRWWIRHGFILGMGVVCFVGVFGCFSGGLRGDFCFVGGGGVYVWGIHLGFGRVVGFGVLFGDCNCGWVGVRAVGALGCYGCGLLVLYFLVVGLVVVWLGCGFFGAGCW